MRDWGTYRKLYDNLPPAFERLLYQARCFAADLLRRCDRAGRIVPGTELTDGLVADVAFHVRAHAGEEDFLRRCLALLLDDGYLAFRDGHLVIRNFVEAQRSESAERMAKKRARDAGLFSESSDHVTSSDARDASDTGDAVTSPSSNLVSSDLISDPDPEQGTRSKPGSPRARAKAPPDVPDFLRPDWVPAAAQVAALAQKWQVPESRILAELPEFRWFWSGENGPRRGTRKTLRGWAQAFGNRVNDVGGRGHLHAAPLLRRREDQPQREQYQDTGKLERALAAASKPSALRVSR